MEKYEATLAMHYAAQGETKQVEKYLRRFKAKFMGERRVARNDINRIKARFGGGT